MTPRLAIAFAFALALAPGAAAPASAAAPPFTPTAPVVRTLENGLKVAVFVDPRLPVVQMQLLLPAGSTQEARDEPGVAAMCARLLTHGTSSRGPSEYAAAVEDLGGSINAVASREFTTIGGSFLARDFEAGLELVVDAALHPTFAESEIEAQRDEAARALAQAHSTPASLADEHLWGMAYDGHPYGRPVLGALDRLAGVRRTQLQTFHRDCYRPDRALLAIVGDVRAEAVFAAVESQLGSWSGRARAEAPAPAARPGTTRIRLINVAGLRQADVRIGRRGPARSSQDYAAIVIANHLLGGNTSARLGQALRGGQSGVQFQRDGGMIWAGAQVSLDSAATVVERLSAELRRFASEPPGEPEVRTARDLFVQAHPLPYDAAGVSAQWLAEEWFGSGDLAQTLGRLRSVTAADVAAAAREWLSTDDLAVVVIGPAAELRSRLEPLGPVEVVTAAAAPIAIDTAPSTITDEPTPAAIEAGRALAGRMVTAHGGLERLRGIKSSSAEGEITILAEGNRVRGNILQVRRDPMQFWFSTRFVGLEVVQVLDGSRAWSMQRADVADSVVDEDSTGVQALRAGFASDIHHVLLAAVDPRSRPVLRGRETVSGKETEVLEVVPPESERFVLFLDPTSHRVLALEQNDGTAARAASVRKHYSDYRTVSGIAWPHQEDREINGQNAMSLAFKRIVVNAPVSDELFRHPKRDSAPRTGSRRGGP